MSVTVYGKPALNGANLAYFSDEPLLPEDQRRFDAPKLRIAFLLWPQLSLVAFAGFVDALRHAGDVGDHSRQLLCSWDVLSDTSEPIETSCGVKVTPTCRLIHPSSFDYVVVVGGLLHAIDDAPSSLRRYLLDAAHHGVPLVGVCTGSFVLAQLGLLNGYRACVGHYHHKDFIHRFPQVSATCDKIFCVDRDRITSAGGSTSMDVASHIVRKHCGKDRAAKITRMLLIDRLRDDSSPQRILHHWGDSITNHRVLCAISMMEQHVAQPLSIVSIAKHVGTSERQLERAFQESVGRTPAHHFRLIRLRYGRWLLTNSRASIMEIAHECGFSDNAHFTRQFRKEFGVAPSNYRQSTERSNSDNTDA